MRTVDHAQSGTGPAPGGATDARNMRHGLVFALAAFSWWGLVPIYFKALGQISPWEILCHRVVWSLVFTAGLVSLKGGWPEVGEALRKRRTLLILACSSVILGSNWLIFIYAVTSDRVLDASLGYYITPLVNFLMGVVFLGERLRPLQIAAVMLAAAGTLNLTISLGHVPWVAISLALTFGTYGLLRKRVDIGAVGGLFAESLVLTPVALAWLLWLGFQGVGSFSTSWRMSLLLAAAGVVTSVPLVWFAAGVRRLPLTIIGLCQYCGPTIYLFLGTVVYDEPFSRTHLITFALIWIGITVFSLDSVVGHRRSRRGI